MSTTIWLSLVRIGLKIKNFYYRPKSSKDPFLKKCCLFFKNSILDRVHTLILIFCFSLIGALIVWIIVIALLLVQWNRTKISGFQRTKFIFVTPQIALIGTLILSFGYILLFACTNDLIDHTPFGLSKAICPNDNIWYKL